MKNVQQVLVQSNELEYHNSEIINYGYDGLRVFRTVVYGPTGMTTVSLLVYPHQPEGVVEFMEEMQDTLDVMVLNHFNNKE